MTMCSEDHSKNTQEVLGIVDNYSISKSWQVEFGKSYKFIATQ